ncbi:MAG: VCBS repeat-containing protein [Myxococcaceae bacterium]|nr:VCBS repeat-containing protein [Myxococcaceae bacterium]
MVDARLLLAGLLASQAWAAPTFRRDDDAGFRLRGQKLAGLGAADLDGDGCPEVIGLSIQFAFDGGPGTRVLRSTCGAPAQFTDVTTSRAPDFPFSLTERSLAMGDLDGDGWTDIVRTGNRSLYVDRNEGPGGPTPFRFSPFPGFPFVADGGTRP